MKEIELIGLGEKIFLHESKCGLKTYMWVNEKVSGAFMTISVKYGSLHTEFKVNDESYKVPNGLAHFLEHIKFNVGPNLTAHEVFLKLGSETNAFTTFKYTNYLVYSDKLIIESLKELMNFVYKSYFTKQLITKEKGIIVGEANMGIDDPLYMAQYGIFNQLFHTSKYKYFITGHPDEIKKISVKDVNDVFDAFYQPKNSFLCLTGNFNPYEMVKTIDEFMDKKEFKKFVEPKIINEKEDKTVVKKYGEMEAKITNAKIKYALKIARNKFKNVSDLELRIYLSLLLTINFGNTSEFKDELVNKEIITDLYASSDILDDYVVLIFTVDTPYFEEVIKLLDEKLDNLDVDDKTFNRKIKANIATLILQFEDIEVVNNKISNDLVTYGRIVDNIKEIYENLNIDTMNNVLKEITKEYKSVLVLKPKKDPEN
ncbi:MAG: pitrilysin family protein [Bacilli bacterium]